MRSKQQSNLNGQSLDSCTRNEAFLFLLLFIQITDFQLRGLYGKTTALTWSKIVLKCDL